MANGTWVHLAAWTIEPELKVEVSDDHYFHLSDYDHSEDVRIKVTTNSLVSICLDKYIYIYTPHTPYRIFLHTWWPPKDACCHGAGDTATAQHREIRGVDCSHFVVPSVYPDHIRDYSSYNHRLNRLVRDFGRVIGSSRTSRFCWSRVLDRFVTYDDIDIPLQQVHCVIILSYVTTTCTISTPPPTTLTYVHIYTITVATTLCITITQHHTTQQLMT